MAIEVFNRYEYKYTIDKQTYEKLIPILEEHMVRDKHNIDFKPYTISNIYYDTDDDYLIRNSVSKPMYKEKLRLRSYSLTDKNKKVFVEIKKKFRGIVNKRRTALTLKEAYDFLKSGEIPPFKDYMNRQVINEIAYFLKIYKVIPKLYLAYDRIAYFEKDNNDLRISFDMNIRSRRYDLEISKGDYGELLLEENTCLMEIKTSSAMPLWLTHTLDELNIHRKSFSKYGTEYKKYSASKLKQKGKYNEQLI